MCSGKSGHISLRLLSCLSSGALVVRSSAVSRTQKEPPKAVQSRTFIIPYMQRFANIQFPLYFFLIVVAFLVAPQAHAAVLYSHEYANQVYTFGFLGESTTGHTLYDVSATNTNYSESQYNYTATEVITHLRLKTDSACAAITPILINNAGSNPYTVTSVATSTNGTCLYALSSFDVGDKLYELYVQATGGYGTTTIYGSSGNTGALYDNYNQQVGLGGFAFQLCSNSSCNEEFETSNIPSLCSTCTRIISTDPGQETVATSTSRDYFVDYYVSPDDFIEGDTLIEVSYQHALGSQIMPSGYSIYTETFRSSVFNSGLNTAIFNFARTYIPGTYNVYIKIYTEVTPPWWKFWATDVRTDLVSYNTYFHAATFTTAEEIEENNERITTSYYFTNFGDPNSTASYLQGWTDRLLHGAPLGYATRIYEIFSATTSTTSNLSITHNFPSTSPAFGKTITLDLSGASEFAIDYIGTERYADFMYFWRFIWYTLLALWLLKEIFGTFNISLEKESYEQKPSKN